MKTLQERFEAKFVRGGDDDCWIWTGSKVKHGYGQIMSEKRLLRANRVSYQLYVGEVPEGMAVLHRCFNASCVNPAHLYLGTNRSNAADTAIERFEQKFIKSSDEGCWEWTSTKNKGGYGRFTYKGRMQVSSRVAYQLYIGEIPKGLRALHRCDNPGCVNPKHLFLGTQSDNMNDCFRKGRMNRAKGEDNSQSRLTNADVLAIRESTEGAGKLAAVYGVSRQTIHRARTRKYWKHIQEGAQHV